MKNMTKENGDMRSGLATASNLIKLKEMHNSHLFKTRLERISKIVRLHIPFDQKEYEDIKFIQNLMTQDPNLLDKNNEKGHFTGSALVLNFNTGEFLLHLHKKLNRWFQFGGHPETEADLAELALRETKEETGLMDLRLFPETAYAMPLDIDVHFIPERKGLPRHPHLDFRYLLVTGHTGVINHFVEDESPEFRWFSFVDIKEVKDLVDPALLRLIKKAERIYRNEKTL